MVLFSDFQKHSQQRIEFIFEPNQNASQRAFILIAYPYHFEGRKQDGETSSFSNGKSWVSD